MEEKKFELTDETREGYDCTLYRIKALKYFSDVKKGELGGFVEKEDNLSQDGNCWVYNDAKVFDEAKVFGNARVYGHAEVHGDAMIYGNACVSDDAQVFGDANVYDNALVYDGTIVYGNAKVYENAEVYGKAIVYDNAHVFGNAHIYGNVCIHGSAQVFGNTWACAYTDIQGNAEIKSINDYAVFKNFWSSGCWFTWTRSNDMWSVDDFYGTGEELVKEAYEDSEKSGKCYEAYVNLMKELNSI